MIDLIEAMINPGSLRPEMTVFQIMILPRISLGSGLFTGRYLIKKNRKKISFSGFI
jgi:hypothetical protein